MSTVTPQNPTTYLNLSRPNRGTTNWNLHFDDNSDKIDAEASRVDGVITDHETRVSGLETDSKYFAYEVHTVTKGNNTITLNHTPEANHKFILYDTKFGCVWQTPVHWTRSGNIITFTESDLGEDFDFICINIG